MNTFSDAFLAHKIMLMEGALAQRLIDEYGIMPDPHIALGAHIYNPEAASKLNTLWREYLSVAERYRLPFLATTPTRRLNRERLGASPFDEAIFADNVAFLADIRASAGTPFYIGGLVGCRADAYSASNALPAAEAFSFHLWSVRQLSNAGVDFLFAGIMPAVSEAVGLAVAAASTGTPYIISFMMDASGHLPDGTSIHSAIAQIDRVASPAPLCYMTNCVHPFTLARALALEENQTPLVRQRFLGIQANASPLPPAELEKTRHPLQSPPKELADAILSLGTQMELRIIGGCCGTNSEYLAQLARGITGRTNKKG